MVAAIAAEAMAAAAAAELMVGGGGGGEVWGGSNGQSKFCFWTFFVAGFRNFLLELERNGTEERRLHR